MISNVHAEILSQDIITQNNSRIDAQNNIWQRLKAGFQLSHDETKEVKYWEKRYANPKYFKIIMQNATPYLFFVLGELERHGMPTELALIPIVETTYNPHAISLSGISTGMWQFLAGSGSRFGLIQNSVIDERMDVVRSTRAAIMYFNYFYLLFNNWELVIAAFNWGEGNINNAVQNAHSQQFYDLQLRDITHQYVPKVLALANIICHPHKFGITLSDVSNNPQFALITLPANTTKSAFLANYQLTARDFATLNPQLLSGDKLLKDQSLIIPIANMPAHHRALPDLANINNNSNESHLATSQQAAIRAESYLIVPLAVVKHQISENLAFSDTESIQNIDKVHKSAINELLNDNDIEHSPYKIYYIVQKGDTLYTIAKKYHVSLIDLIKINHLDGKIKPSQKLSIPLQVHNILPQHSI